jgi:hypothetical protein
MKKILMLVDEITIAVVEKLARALDISVDELLK